MDVGFAPGGSSSAFDANPRSEEENARGGNRKLSTAPNLLLSSFALMSNGTQHTGPRVPLPRSREEHGRGGKLLTETILVLRRLQANAGALTNLEVLEFLRARGATSDPMGCLGAVAPSECKVTLPRPKSRHLTVLVTVSWFWCGQVFDYLVNTAACNQTRGAIDEFVKRCEKFKLAKAEKFNIINLRPSNQALIDPIIEYCEKRLTKDEARGIDEVQELVDLVLEVLPPPPAKPDEEMQDLEETPTEKPMEEN
ncbi:hypothetical protein B296_00018006 [Ensete ventricosum]|uniref:DNA-directed RNA polymerase III subunit RPC9 n=1 Tax=Ensete ventricosum TaxID=4639 RepID=A0A426ZV77_ENSVE|nr:hypothetical protein B296_00018006 [Ensete ventricosum]